MAADSKHDLLAIARARLEEVAKSDAPQAAGARAALAALGGTPDKAARDQAWRDKWARARAARAPASKRTEPTPERTATPMTPAEEQARSAARSTTSSSSR